MGTVREAVGPGTSIVEATASYEDWLASHIPLLAPALEEKHRRMREGPFPFLRGTYYRWLQRFPHVLPELSAAPSILAVGDLHIENFGTWRDREGRLVWGINDLDELARLPYTSDLVRLSASAILAGKAGELTIGPRGICKSLLEGYLAGLERRPQPFLAEGHRWLREQTARATEPPKQFWADLCALPQATDDHLPSAAAASLLPLLPGANWKHELRERTAGVGSLGHRRIVAFGEWAGGLVARELKELGPPALSWVAGQTRPRRLGIPPGLLEQDPWRTVIRGWSVRRLSPECVKLDMAKLSSVALERRLLRAMGGETASLHVRGGARTGQIARDLKRRKDGWLMTAAELAVRDVRSDWRQWKQHSGTRRGAST